MKKAVMADWLVCSGEEVRQDSGFIFENGIIQEILPNSLIKQAVTECALAEVYEAHIAIPGFVNAHTHQYGLVSHGAPVRKSFTDFEGFLSNYWWPDIEDRITRHVALTTARASCCMMLSSGVTAFCDTLEAPFVEPETLEAQANVIEELGMRAIVSLESSERVNTENGVRCLEANVSAVRHARKNLTLVRGGVCVHTTFTCSDAFIKRAFDLAATEECLFQFHLSESVYEPSRRRQPAFVYDSLGALGPRTLASQCVVMTPEELDLLASRQTKVVHMPLSNCEVGGGVAPVPEMLERGMTVGLGSDGYIDDFFTVMKGAFLIHKAEKKRTDVMPAHTVFSMATEGGAACMGLEKVGKLQTGWAADCVLLREGFHSPVTRENIFDQLVVHGTKETVATVFVNGKVLLHNNGTVPEPQKAYQEVRDCIRDFWMGM